MKNTFTKTLLSATIALVLSINLYALDASVEASGFNPAHIRPNTSTTFTVTLKNVSGNISPSDIPFPSGLQVIGQSRSASFSMGTGGNSQETKIAYTLVARKEGTYNIPAWKLKLGGQEFSMPAVSLKVSEDAPETPATVMSGGFDPFSQIRRVQRQRVAQPDHSVEDSLRNKIALELKMPKENLYVGESVDCELVFSFDKSLPKNGFNLQQLIPQAKKADDFECSPFTAKPAIDIESNPEKVLIKFKLVITPLKVGNYTLDFSANGMFAREMGLDDIMNMSFFDRMSAMGMAQRIPFEVNMPDKKLNILALPDEGKPASFNGAIGKFALKNVSVEPDALSVGEPCVISAQIEGIGNFPRVGAPKLLHTADWKTYKPKSSFVDKGDGTNRVGIKTFDFTAVPNKADLSLAPVVEFSWFNPFTQKYETASSKPTSVSVAPSGRSRKIEESKEEENAPAFSRVAEKNSDKINALSLAESPIFWGINISLILAVLAFVALRRHKMKLENNPAYAKFIRDSSNSARFLAKAEKAAKEGNSVGFFENAKSAIQYAIACSSDSDAAAILFEDARKSLQETDPFLSESVALREIFDGADLVKFGGSPKTNADLIKLHSELKKFANTAVGKGK